MNIENGSGMILNDTDFREYRRSLRGFRLYIYMKENFYIPYNRKLHIIGNVIFVRRDERLRL